MNRNFDQKFGSGALNGKMVHVKTIENNRIDTYFRTGQVK